MTGYYDPDACGGCRARVEIGQRRCGSCGMRLDEPAAWRLEELLREADALVRELRLPAAVGDAYDPLRPAAGAAPDPAPAPGPVAATAQPQGVRLPALSVPAVLLGLGALCVLAAAVVFVAVTWGDLSVGTRTLLLLAVTGAFAVGAVASVRSGLRGSAEALWLVVAGLLVLDAVGARAAGLLGLDRVPEQAYATGCGLAALAGFAALARVVGRTRLGGLVTAELVAATGWVVVVVAQAEAWPGDDGWFAALATVASAAVGLAARRAELPVLAYACGAVALLAWLTLSAYGMVAAVENPGIGRLWLDGEGGLLLVAALLAGVAAALVSGVSARADVVSAVAAAAAVGGVAALGWLPLAAAGPTPATAGLAVGAAVLMGVRLLDVPARERPWAHGATAVSCLGLLGCVVPLGVLAVAVGEAALGAALPVWASTASTDTVPSALSDAPAAWTLPLLLVAVGWSVALLVDAAPWVPMGLAAAAAGAALSLLGAVPLVVAVVVPVGFGAVLLVAAWIRGVAAAEPVGALLVGGAGLVALGSTGVTAGLATVVAAGALVGVRLRTGTTASAALTAVAVLAGEVAVFGWLSLGPTSPSDRVLVLVLVAAGVLVVAGAWPRVPGESRAGAEAAVALVAVVSVLLLSEAEAFGRLAVALTALGVAVVLLAVLAPQRRRVAPLGGVLLAAATWVRLADSGVEVVEAYTLPSALVLVVAGSWRLRTDRTTSTLQSLAPGLGLAIVPSLLLALEDPATVRGLLVGLASLGLVVAGTALRWGAPLVVGAIALALLAVAQLGPYALAVPRWTLFAAAGALLLFGGVTWERRRAELATAARYVADLR